MTSLFGEPIELKPAGIEPTDDELGEAVSWATLMAVNKKFLGKPPASMSKKELARELIEPTLKRCRKWRAGGKVQLTNYAYVSACNALTDYMRKQHDAERKEQTTQDALIHAASEFVLYGDEHRKYLLAKALFANLRASAGRDVFDTGVVNLAELERIF